MICVYITLNINKVTLSKKNTKLMDICQVL